MTSLLAAGPGSSLRLAQSSKAAPATQIASAQGKRSSLSKVEVAAQAAISPASSTAAELLENARAFVKKESMVAFQGYDKPHKDEACYLNVDKYNDYIVKQAFAGMSESAKRLGIELDPTQTMDALSSAKPEGKQIDTAARLAAFGPNSSITELSMADLDSLTNLYIRAKESGADTAYVAVAASQIGNENYCRNRGIEYVVVDDNGDPIGNDALARARPTTSVIEAAATLKTAMQRIGFGVPDSTLENLIKMDSTSNKVSRKLLEFFRLMAAQ